MDVGTKGGLTPVERTALEASWHRWQCSLSGSPAGASYDGSYDARLSESLSEAEQEQLKQKAANATTPASMIVVRTASLDDALLWATGAHKTHTSINPRRVSTLPSADIRQVVILGAGLDARAWRLQWPPGVDVYEVDSGATEALKQRVLGPLPLRAASRHALVADLNQPQLLEQLLTGAGFDLLRPAVWLLEGLIGYLSVSAGSELLRATYDLSAPGSQLLLTCPPTPAFQREGLGTHHITYEESEDTQQRVVAAGWSGAELISSDTLQEVYQHVCWQAQVHAAKQ